MTDHMPIIVALREIAEVPDARAVYLASRSARDWCHYAADILALHEDQNCVDDDPDDIKVCDLRRQVISEALARGPGSWVLGEIVIAGCTADIWCGRAGAALRSLAPQAAEYQSCDIEMTP